PTTADPGGSPRTTCRSAVRPLHPSPDRPSDRGPAIGTAMSRTGQHRLSRGWTLLALVALSTATACRAADANEERVTEAVPAPSGALKSEPPTQETDVVRVAREPSEGSEVTGLRDGTPDEGHADLLDGEPAYRARKPPRADVPRVYAKSRNVWVRGRPTSKTLWIGFLWFGSSVPLKSTEPVAGYGCKTWYAIEPKGYVCVDGERAT